MGQSTDWQAGYDDEPAGEVASGLSLKQFEEWHEECKKQPPWRATADKESEFFDGNQLDSDLVRAQQSIGMAPAIDPLMGPELDELCGLEARLRKNWKVVPNSDVADDEVAEALNAKLNAAERHSKSDKTCSLAFRGQAGIGVAIVCVDRETDPFKFPYRTTIVNRNDCWWDWKGSHDPDMHDHRYFIRRRWTDKTQAKLFFPESADLIEHAATGWTQFDSFTNDGGTSTGLLNQVGKVSFGGVGTPTRLQDASGSYALLSAAKNNEEGRGSSIEEQEWRDIENKRICIFEVWYRVWSSAKVFRSPDGRTIEVDADNELHQAALSSGQVEVENAVISKVRVAMFIGPHRMSDNPTPFKHNKFPYVPFWGKHEDRTGVPYGLGRGWIYHQESINSLSAKLRWGISAVTTKRTKGAYAGTDDQFRRISAMVNADIVLDPKAMSEGGILEISRDFQLTDQQANMLIEARKSIKRTGMGIDDEDQKNDGKEQLETIPNQHGILFDNFKESRNEVGERLLSMIIEDMEGKPQEVVIKGDVSTDDKVVQLNVESIHPETGEAYLTNDVSRTMLKVVLEDVPTTPTYRAQQMASLSEVIKSAPEKFQPILFPHLLTLADIPDRDKLIISIRDAAKIPSEEEIAAKIDQAVKDALQKAGVDNKTRELELKAQLQTAQIEKLTAESMLTRVTASYESMQTAGTVAQNPALAPIADVIMQQGGNQPTRPGSVSPEFDQMPLPDDVQRQAVIDQAQQNTSPAFPPRPSSPAIGAKAGIETQRLTDGVQPQ